MLLFRLPHFSAGTLSVLALTLVMSTLLSACGFSPLYGQRGSADFTVEKHLALIQVQPIKNRIGQHLHNNLLARLNLKGRPANPLYKLNVTLIESNANLGIKKTAVVTRGNLKLTATFTLSKSVNVASKIESKNLMIATVTAISSYDIPEAHYLALIALKDARARAVKETADDIRTRLGIYFHQSPQ
jgi:LPS-assembly lipoprotein